VTDSTVTVLSTGGTVASTGGEGGAEPTVSGSDLLASVALPAGIDLSVEQVAQVPGFGMNTAILARLARRITDIDSGTVDGIVVTHGTDTMAESAYYLDVALDPDTPVVFTGAQRRPDEGSADGPANIRTAVTAALHPDVRDAGGVYLAFNQELHAARDVVKSHTHKLETFASPGKGPVAVSFRDGLRFHREPGSRSTHIPVLETAATVPTVQSGVGVDGGPIRRTLPDLDGLVVAGTGLGNVSPALADTIDEALGRDLPVVLTSRCYAGGVNGVYGTSGGGKQLLDAGVLPASDLPSQKARLKLMLAVEAADRPEDVAEYF
jgi:L-asparaginase